MVITQTSRDNMITRGLKLAAIKEKTEGYINSGTVSQVLRNNFPEDVANCLFELISVGQTHEDELDAEYTIPERDE